MRLGVLTAKSDGLVGEEALRGVYLALAAVDYRVAGQRVELVTRATSGTSASAVHAAAALLDDEGCDVVIGPLFSVDDFAIRDFARTRPDHVFINGASTAQAIFNPAPNVFTFSGSGVQSMAGMGRYCYDARNYRRVAIVAESSAEFYDQVGGFCLEFNQTGGEIVEMIWCDAGAGDYTETIQRIPDDADALLCVLNGADFVRFMRQLRALQGDLPVITGPAAADPTILQFSRHAADSLEGVLVAGPVVDDNPDYDWLAFVSRYCAAYPHDLHSPSRYATHYYTAARAALLALDAVGGDMGRGRQRLMQALSDLMLDAPTGPVRLNARGCAIVSNYIGEIAVTEDSIVYTNLIHAVTEVKPTLGLPLEDYYSIGDFSAANTPYPLDAESFLMHLHQQQSPKAHV